MNVFTSFIPLPSEDVACLPFFCFRGHSSRTSLWKQRPTLPYTEPTGTFIVDVLPREL